MLTLTTIIIITTGIFTFTIWTSVCFHHSPLINIKRPKSEGSKLPEGLLLLLGLIMCVIILMSTTFEPNITFVCTLVKLYFKINPHSIPQQNQRQVSEEERKKREAKKEAQLYYLECMTELTDQDRANPFKQGTPQYKAQKELKKKKRKSSYTDKLPKKKRLLLQALSNPIHKGKTFDELCAIVGISLGYAWKCKKDPIFLKAIQSSCTLDFLLASPSIVKSFIKEAQEGSYKHGELALKTAGIVKDTPLVQQIIANFNQDGVKEEDIDRKLNELFAIDITKRNDDSDKPKPSID